MCGRFSKNINLSSCCLSLLLLLLVFLIVGVVCLFVCLFPNGFSLFQSSNYGPLKHVRGIAFTLSFSINDSYWYTASLNPKCKSF